MAISSDGVFALMMLLLLRVAYARVSGMPAALRVAVEYANGGGALDAVAVVDVVSSSSSSSSSPRAQFKCKLPSTGAAAAAGACCATFQLLCVRLSLTLFRRVEHVRERHVRVCVWARAVAAAA